MVMPDLIRHPETQDVETALDSGSSPDLYILGNCDTVSVAGGNLMETASNKFHEALPQSLQYGGDPCRSIRRSP
jgi:hypothetical protein